MWKGWRSTAEDAKCRMKMKVAKVIAHITSGQVAAAIAVRGNRCIVGGYSLFVAGIQQPQQLQCNMSDTPSPLAIKEWRADRASASEELLYR